MKIRSSDLDGFLLRMALALVVLALLCCLGMWMMPGQCLRLTVIALFVLSVACGAFVPEDGLRASFKPESCEPAKGFAPRREDRVSEIEREGGSQERETEKDVAPAIPQPGEAEFLRARSMRHQEIPECLEDRLYFKLLSESSEKGYAPATVELGESAMRRAAWVEAYYWMSMAKRQGMRNLGEVMRQIRRNWSLADFPDEMENVSEIFTTEAGSIGRALLHVDSGYKAAAAQKFLSQVSFKTMV